MVRVTYPKNPEPSLPQNTNYLVLLFQQPHLWNTRHQQFLKVRVFYDAPAEMIVGLANLPRNGDEEFESLATQFTLPSKEDLSIFQWRDPIFEGNPFTRVFEHLGEMIEMADLTEPATDVEIKNRSKYRAHNNKYHRLSQHSVRDFIDAVGSSIHLSTEFHTPSEDIKYHVPSCKVKGALRCEGSIARRSDTRARITLPLVTFAAIHPHKPKGCITNEIPHILVQAIIAFQRNPDLNKFRGHMIRQEGAYFEISSALVSRAYIQSVQLGRVPTEDISLFRSGTYDLREQEGRREALRTLIGMMRYLDEAWFDG